MPLLHIICNSHLRNDSQSHEDESDGGSDTGSESGLETITREKVDLKEPKLFKVFLLNDDYTTMDFVVAILESIFHKSPSEATAIMLQVHQKGSGLCGIYPREIAEAKIFAVENRAEEQGHPLKCILEEA